MKQALIVIDMQNGFLNPESPLCIKGARATVPACARVIAACRAAGIPGKVSFSAGAYVCNCLMYHVLELIENRYPDMRGGFIHVPYECRQAAAQEKQKPSLPIGTIADGLLACLKAL